MSECVTKKYFLILKQMGYRKYLPFYAQKCLSKPVYILGFSCVSLLVCVLLSLPHGVMGWSVIVAFIGHTDSRIFYLTHLSGMEFPTIINWTSLFPFLGLLGGIFNFYSNFKRNFCKHQWRT